MSKYAQLAQTVYKIYFIVFSTTCAHVGNQKCGRDWYVVRECD